MKGFIKRILGVSIISSTVYIIVGCTNPTSEVGAVSTFTTGVVTDVEVIDIQKNKYDTTTSAIAGAAGGAAIGQIAANDTRGTLIGAGIGAAVAGLSSMALDRGEGMRVTIETDKGPIIVDQPYSKDIKKGAKVRMINHSSGMQLQVFDGTTYKTAAY